MSDQTPPTGRWQRRLLVASLALNLLIVGAIIGLLVSGGPKGGPQRFDLTSGPVTRAMEPERRDRIRDALRDSEVFRPSNRADMRADMAAILSTLRAASFDEDAFRSALTRQRARLQAGQEAVLAAVSAEISDMSAEERAAFADRLEEQLRRGPAPRDGDRNN